MEIQTNDPFAEDSAEVLTAPPVPHITLEENPFLKHWPLEEVAFKKGSTIVGVPAPSKDDDSGEVPDWIDDLLGADAPRTSDTEWAGGEGGGESVPVAAPVAVAAGGLIVALAATATLGVTSPLGLVSFGLTAAAAAVGLGLAGVRKRQKEETGSAWCGKCRKRWSALMENPAACELAQAYVARSLEAGLEPRRQGVVRTLTVYIPCEDPLAPDKKPDPAWTLIDRKRIRDGHTLEAVVAALTLYPDVRSEIAGAWDKDSIGARERVYERKTGELVDAAMDGGIRALKSVFSSREEADAYLAEQVAHMSHLPWPQLRVKIITSDIEHDGMDYVLVDEVVGYDILGRMLLGTDTEMAERAPIALSSGWHRLDLSAGRAARIGDAEKHEQKHEVKTQVTDDEDVW